MRDEEIREKDRRKRERDEEKIKGERRDGKKEEEGKGGFLPVRVISRFVADEVTGREEGRDIHPSHLLLSRILI